MPFTGKTFSARHNKSMQSQPTVATKAAQMANAMIKGGTPEGVAIATANKRAAGAVAKERAGTIKEHRQRSRPYA